MWLDINEKLKSRRGFMKNSSTIALGTSIGLPALSITKCQQTMQDQTIKDQTIQQQPLEIHLFSKHLQFLDYKDMAKASADMGFDGVDLTVRPKGHVLPENVERDLPLAINAIKEAGLKSELMSTAILNVEQKHTKTILAKAAQQGIQYYRLGYYKFDKKVSIPDSLSDIRSQVNGLADLNKKLNIHGAYQNHAGVGVGAAIWDIWEMLKESDVKYMGCQYDIRHATVEGGQSWTTGLRLIQPKINTLVLKDFIWEKTGDTWKLKNVPVGEGMVDFEKYFKWLKEHNINVPVSLHCEYDLGGAEHGDREIKISNDLVYKAIRQDVARIRKMWNAV